jgi:hypothetical protein
MTNRKLHILIFNLAEDRAGRKTSVAAVKDEPLFRLYDVITSGKFFDNKVKNRHFLFVGKHAKDDQRR